MLRANADLRGPLPARHLDRPAADRQGPDRDRARARRRRRRPRRHRQGQRPGALRAHLRRPRARAARSSPPGATWDVPGPRRPDRLRREARHPGPGHRARSPTRIGPQPAAHQLRGRHPRGPVARAADGHVRAHASRPRRRPTSREYVEIDFEARRPGRGRTASASRPRRCSRAQRRSAASTASAGSTWSRTATSA